MKITVGHTHDADDAFMFYALLNKRIDLEGLVFEDFLEPISELNRKAAEGFYSMTAASVASLPLIVDKYDVLTAGACMAEKRGPVIVMNKNREPETVAVSGLSTTSYFVSRLYNPDFQYYVMPFDKIFSAVKNREVDAGILISEDQMLVDPEKYTSLDLGLWWYDQTGLPLPLGIDVVDKSLPEDIKISLNRVFRRSISYALNNPDEAGEYALKFGRGIDQKKGMDFISTFVNDYTVDLGDKGKKAVNLFLSKCKDAKIIKQMPQINFID